MNRFLLITILFAAVTSSSCHRKIASAPISCCPKSEVAGMEQLSRGTISTSIYQLPGVWTDQHARHLSLQDLKGKVQVISMIFTHCGYACPRLVEDIKAVEDSLPASQKNDVGYVLVSFDSKRDDPAQLDRFAAEHGLDGHWRLLHGDAAQVREVSMLLNVRYRQTPDGNFSHSNTIVILDKDGQVISSLDGLEAQTAAAVNTINRLLAKN